MVFNKFINGNMIFRKHLTSGERYLGSKWPLIAEKKMAGEIECRARNTVGEGSDIVKINVQHAPEVTVKVLEETIHIMWKIQERVNPNEGERVEIECFVNANPRAGEIRWAGPDGFLSEGPILTLNSVKR